MLGFLGTKAPLLSDVGWRLEFVVLGILIFGRLKFVRHKGYVKHGETAAYAVSLHALSIFLVMIPSLYYLVQTKLSILGMLILLTHVPAGILAEILGILLVIKWRFRSPPDMDCVKRRRLMKPLFWLWMFALVLGITVYLYFYL